MRRAERDAGSPCPEPDRTPDPDSQPPGGLPPDGQPAGSRPVDGRPAGTPARGLSSLRPLRHRRPVLILGNAAAAATAVVLAVLVAGGHDSPLALVVLVTLQGSAAAVIGPFQQAILPDLVPQEEFLAAISLNSAQFNLGRIVGPALAGATVAAFGYPMAFVANAVSFLAVVVALAFVRLAAPAGRPSGLIASLRSGFAAARREPSCWAAITTIAVVAVLASPFIALVPVMARHLTQGGATAVAQTTAVLTTAQGAGAVAGALSLAPLASRLGRGRVLAGSLILLPVALIGYSAAQQTWQGAAGIFVVGLVYIGVLSGLSTVVQLRAPQAYRVFVAVFRPGFTRALSSEAEHPLTHRR